MDLLRRENVGEWKGIYREERDLGEIVPEEWKPLWRPSKKTRGTSMERMTRPSTAITSPLHRRFAGTPYDGTAPIPPPPPPPLFIGFLFLFFFVFFLFSSYYLYPILAYNDLTGTIASKLFVSFSVLF